MTTAIKDLKELAQVQAQACPAPHKIAEDRLEHLILLRLRENWCLLSVTFVWHLQLFGEEGDSFLLPF